MISVFVSNSVPTRPAKDIVILTCVYILGYGSVAGEMTVTFPSRPFNRITKGHQGIDISVNASSWETEE